MQFALVLQVLLRKNVNSFSKGFCVGVVLCFFDLEVIVLSMTSSETLGIDNECYLFPTLPTTVTNHTDVQTNLISRRPVILLELFVRVLYIVDN